MLPTIDPAALADVNGGLVEGIRNTFNAGAVALNLLNPMSAPVKTIPEPAPIVRIQPNAQTIGGK